MYTYVWILKTLVDDGEKSVRDLVIVLMFGSKGSEFGWFQVSIVGQPIGHNRFSHSVVNRSALEIRYLQK